MQRYVIGQGAQSKVLIANGYSIENEDLAPKILKYAIKITLPLNRNEGEVNHSASGRLDFIMRWQKSES